MAGGASFLIALPFPLSPLIPKTFLFHFPFSIFHSQFSLLLVSPPPIPDDDPPMDPAPILTRLNWERQHIPLGGEILEHAGDVVRLRNPDGSHHVIIWSELTGETADAIIDREIQRHQALGVTFEWKVYSHDQPPDLKDRLANRGLEIGDQESVMILDLAGRQSWIEPPSANHKSQIENPKSAVHVECVQTSTQVVVFKEVAEEVFGGDWSFTANQLLAAINRQDITHRGYIGYLNDTAASVGRLYVHPESWFAGLYGGGTRPDFRGWGVYRATVAARARDAIKWGAKYLMVDARETSRAILERMGFEKVGETWPCVFQ